MADIDKNMYEKLKKWCAWCEDERPHDRNIMYVNSWNRELTGATIRKLMFEMWQDDVEGELYISLYSARNFCRNMKGYYSEISELYMQNPDEDASMVDIIEDYPPTCGWLVLIVEDIEKLSDDAEKMKDMMESIFAFAPKHPSIILVGNGDYKEVYSGCEDVMRKMADGFAAKEEGQLMIGYYEQGTDPERESVLYGTLDKQRDELSYYWSVVYDQFEKKYFDYMYFKALFKETLGYISQRVTKEQVYRKDITLIEHIGYFRRIKSDGIEGCGLWELDAAKKMARGLYNAIVNEYGDNDEFSEKGIDVCAVIEEKKQDYGAIHISGSYGHTIKLNVDTVCCEMDRLAEAILECTYKGNTGYLWKYVDGKTEEDILEDGEKSIGSIMGALMGDIKKAAEKTINKEPGVKVRRYKGE